MNRPPARHLIRIGLALILGLGLTWLAIGNVALAHLPDSPDFPPPTQRSSPPDYEGLSSPIYARVLTGNVPVYQHPLDARQGVDPLRTLDAGYVWVTLAGAQPLAQGNEMWYAINSNEYVQGAYLEPFQPSTFRGRAISTSQSFAWMVFDAYTAAVPGELPDAETVLLERYTMVPIEAEQLVGDRIWYRVGYRQWVEQGMVGIASPKPRPDGIGPTDQWIEVDLYEQTLAAYEGDRLVYATLVSSGLPWWETESGLFQVWLKVKEAKMSGRDGYPDYYFLEDVPWTMYFNEEFALHGAYWHDRFGIKHSHGCVNLSLADAQWLFEWTSPQGPHDWLVATEENQGTWVWVHH